MSQKDFNDQALSPNNNDFVSYVSTNSNFRSQPTLIHCSNRIHCRTRSTSETCLSAEFILRELLELERLLELIPLLKE